MYNDYCLPSSWYEPDYYEERECSKCEHNEKVTNVVQEYLSDIISMIYGNEELDLAKFDDALGCLCDQLDVEQPTKRPNLTRPENLKTWIENNNNFLKQLA